MESSSQSLLPLPAHRSQERAGALELHWNLDKVQPHCMVPTPRIRQSPPCSGSLSSRLQPARGQSDAVSKQRISSFPAVTGEAFLRNLFELRLLFKPLSNLNHLATDCFPKNAAEVTGTGAQTRGQDAAPGNGSPLLVCDGLWNPDLNRSLQLGIMARCQDGGVNWYLAPGFWVLWSNWILFFPG